MNPSHFIAGQWTPGTPGGGAALTAIDPTTQKPSWQGRAATSAEVDAAVAAARRACEGWADTPLATRIEIVQAYAAAIKQHEKTFADAICISTGKPRWEAMQEVGLMVAKCAVSIEAYHERRGEKSKEIAGARAVTRFRPHGVCAVLGPFNLPGHLPNGHIMPALIAGNTVVFKPSEQTPLVGQRMVEIWEEVVKSTGGNTASLLGSVVNLVQGGRETGAALAAQPGIDGLFFTGSHGAGLALSRAFAETPERILALEMGGNNPLVIDTEHIADLGAAAHHTVLSAFITAGQRCTCARRLIVIENTGGRWRAFLDKLTALTKSLRVGKWDAVPPPFMGPVISVAAAQRVLAAQAELIGRGAEVLCACGGASGESDSTAMLTAGLLDVTGVPQRGTSGDVEIFGPLLQIIRVKTFDDAIREVNETSYGLAGGLFSDKREHWDRFQKHIRAGVVNWNRQTTGASGQLPFGGVGHSGNHRPSGYYAADYCSWAVASLEYDRVAMPEKPTPGMGG